MSGPKGFNAVVAERIRVAQETEAARARCAALVQRCELAEGALAELTRTKRHTKRPATAGVDLTSARELETRLTAVARQLEEELREVRVAAVRSHLAAVFDTVTHHELTMPTLAAEATPAAGPRSGEARAARSSVLTQRVAKALDLIAQLDQAPRQALAERVETVRDCLARGDLPQADVALLQVHTEVEHALRAQRSRDAVRAQAADLLIRTAHIHGDEADALRARALACVTDQEFAAVLAAESDLVAAHDAARDRAYVVAQTRRALRELGYEVGEAFEAAALAGTGAVAMRADLPGYGLQWRFGPRPGQVFTNVVAFAPTDPQRDTEVEELTCGHVDGVREAWRAGGIDAELGHHRAAGVVRVERLTRRPAATQRRTAREGRARSADLAGGAGDGR